MLEKIKWIDELSNLLMDKTKSKEEKYKATTEINEIMRSFNIDERKEYDEWVIENRKKVGANREQQIESLLIEGKTEEEIIEIICEYNNPDVVACVDKCIGVIYKTIRESITPRVIDQSQFVQDVKNRLVNLFTK
jgi:hypothetical protein